MQEVFYRVQLIWQTLAELYEAWLESLQGNLTVTELPTGDLTLAPLSTRL